MKKSQVLVTAAIAGILGASMVSGTATAADGDKGHCMGANACKGKGGCKTASNDCKGKNGCKGKGFTETTKAECDKTAKKNSAVKFEMPS